MGGFGKVHNLLDGDFLVFYLRVLSHRNDNENELACVYECASFYMLCIDVCVC